MAKFSVLVVEDNFDTQSFLRVLLESEGFHVITADHGAKAVDLLEEFVPHLIVTDLMMPRLSGGALIRHVKKTPRLCEIPIIVLSAYSKSYEADAYAAGAAVVLQKPISGEQLIETIKQTLADCLLTSGESDSVSEADRSSSTRRRKRPTPGQEEQPEK